MENSNSSRSSSILPFIGTTVRSQHIHDNITIPTKLLLNENQQWKKWKCLGPRWTSPDLYSLPSPTTVFHKESCFQRQTDEESTITGSSTVGDHDEVEPKKKSLIALCKALMLYGAPCHRIVILLMISIRKKKG